MARHKGKKKQKTDSPTIENRRARHDYEILETVECGLRLYGSEVKSVRDAQISIAEGFVRARAEPPELTLHGVNIGPYPPAAALNHHPTRMRTLLAHKREIAKLAKLQDQKGIALVPLKVYFANGFAKLLVGVGQGRGKGDKRRAIAEREVRRDIDRAMSRKRIG
ncbi:MAG: SsrA-binding protein SmpB [Planctomycetota bacterium]